MSLFYCMIHIYYKVGGTFVFADILKQLRNNREVSQDELAKAIHVSVSAISQYENDHTMPNLESLRLIAEFFDVSIDFLLGNSPYQQLEEKLSQDYYNGCTVSSLVDKCMNVTGKHRETLLDVVESLELRSKDNK